MSQRIIIVGVSESGKSSLANKLIAESPLPVFIRDPVGAAWNKCNARFETSDELSVLLSGNKINGKNRGCVCVIDEGADYFTVGQKQNHWIFTRGRHFAMLPIVICHYVKAMAPIVRDQSTDLFVFESSIQTSELLAESYNMDDLKSAHELQQGEYFHVRRVGNERICTAHALW